MTPDRWSKIERLFTEGLGIKPGERQAWLLVACGNDEDVRAEVARLLEQDEQASRDRFMTARPRPGLDPDQTGSWHSHRGHSSSRGPKPIDRSATDLVAGNNGFSPRPAIATDTKLQPISENELVVRARLRELPMIHILTLVMANFWRSTILGDMDDTCRYLDLSSIAFLGALVALLWTRWRIPLAWLQALELLMISILATRLAIVEYHLVLTFSLFHDPMMAQFTLKNVVLLTAILIPSYGLYVPKNWRRAAVVVGPLALLPFVTLLFVYLRHPGTMSWLLRGARGSASPLYLLFSFDAMVLFILAIASTFGARVISLLRRQIAEARHLGQYRLRRQIGVGGMGEVYLAEHQLLKRPCAIKLLRSDNLADPRSLARFEREVRLTAALSHPNTVEIYDYGRTDKGTYYYVMEYLPGMSLADLVRAPWPAAAGTSRIPTASDLSGPWRGARGGPDPSRHQAVKYLCLATWRNARRRQAARFRPRSAHCQDWLAPTEPGGPDLGHAPFHVARAGDWQRRTRRPQRYLLAGGSCVFPADRASAIRRRRRPPTLDSPRARPCRAAVDARGQRAPGRGACRLALPVERSERSVRGFREPRTGPC